MFERNTKDARYKKIMLWECSFVSPALHHIMMVISLFQHKGIKIF